MMSTILQGKLLFPFIAPPNGGKGTQTRILSERYKLPTFDMGATFRSIFKDNLDPEMLAVIQGHQERMNAGGLLPDDVVAMVFEKHFSAFAARYPEAPGFILDGFPRTRGQAEALDQLCQQWGAHLAKVIYLNVSLPVVEKRATGRRVCSRDEGHVYNIKEPKFAPKQQKTNEQGQTVWLCDLDQAELIIRKDDEAATVQKRLAEYQTLTDPLIGYYRQRGDLVEINGEQPAEQVTQEIETVLQPLLGLSPAS